MGFPHAFLSVWDEKIAIVSLLQQCRWLRLLPLVRVKSERRFEWPQRFFERDLICRVKKGHRQSKSQSAWVIWIRLNLDSLFVFYITVVYFFLRTFWAVTSTLYILVWIHKVCKRQLTCVPSHVIKGICRRRPICACAHVCPRSFKDSVAQVYGQWAGCHVSAVRVLQVWLGIRLYQAGHQLHKMHLSLSLIYIYN